MTKLLVEVWIDGRFWDNFLCDRLDLELLVEELNAMGHDDVVLKYSV